MSKKSEFDASASMLGYLYQIRFGLYLSLKKLPEVDDPEQFNISIETLDDVAFDNYGSAIELLQTKYHGDLGNLTNRSADIWKTIRVWVEAVKSGDVVLGRTTLTLVTTQSLPENTLAYYLNPESGRDTAKALELMLDISTEENATNGKGYTAFQSLSETQKKAFVNDIYVVGKSEDLMQIRSKIYRYGRQYVASEWVEAFVDRIEGVWFQWCIEGLSQDPSGVINLGDIQDLADRIRPEYTAINLPAEFTDALPDILEIDQDARSFVQQLRLFNAPNSMVEQAIVNYFRAFEQRTKWACDGLVEPGELSGFDRQLYEQWVEHQSFIELSHEINSERDKRLYSAELYQKCLQEGVIPIRKNFLEAYVAKGSYHILSEQLRIGWHPDYLEMLGGGSNEDVA
ncbi:ABC-three component system protein [uncultured Shewanella sp.]|uniref:ABC-three component system protein n=1 Tax=uncultured Shewanella sp. TaxID=173975 RepID=UPI002629E96D|nr:ABC-three component system protein [uncultured Shewanella sp.]